MHNVDLVLFALVAVFLVLRLRSVLGQRNDSDQPPAEGWRRSPVSESPQDKRGDNVIDLNSARGPKSAQPPADMTAAEAQLWSIEPDFDLNGFLNGARSAFHMILESYAAGDRQALRPLLADEVYEPFARAIDQRQQAGESLSAEIMAFRAVELAAARQDGPLLLLTVRFVTDQVNMRKDRDGRILDGDPIRSNRIADEWTFCRDRRSSDPNWLLVSTRAPTHDPA